MKIALGRKGETLVGNERLEKIFYHLQRLVDFPSSLSFLTQVQEPTDKEAKRLAVFLVISEDPANPGEELVTTGGMPYDRWAIAEKDYRHYAGLSDPLYPIFAGLVRQHLEYRKNLEGLHAVRTVLS